METNQLWSNAEGYVACSNAMGLSNWLWANIIELHPWLANCTSLSQVSKDLFGVKNLTHLVKDWDEENGPRLTAFFGTDHSGLTQWAGVTDRVRFYATPDHAKAYKRMIKDFGLELAVKLTQDHDFGDIVIGLEFIRADKKRLKAFNEDILGALSIFPKAAHSKMIHDYIVAKMKAEERKANPKLVAVATLPVPVETPVAVEGFQVLIPQNEGDLRKIGNAQNHCVGTKGMGYANKIKAGRIWIFALFTKTLADGVCIEIGQDGQVYQVQGRHRRPADQKESQAIDTVIKQLIAA